jgi:hypothetical protein
MRIANVPAQITTVEDKVAGNLSLSQLVLLLAPIFVSTGIYAIMPPTMSAPLYKVALMAVVLVVFSVLAVKFRGKILLLWVIVLLNYNLRPRYSVSNKNDTYLRDIPKPEVKQKSQLKNVVREAKEALELSVIDKARLQDMLSNPNAKLQFLANKKGGLSVHISEVE